MRADIRSLTITEATLAAALAAAPAAAKTCEVSVEFGSFCCGIDRPGFDSVRAFLDARGLTGAYSIRSWGREGEQTICISAADPAEARELVTAIREHLPRQPRSGYVKLRGPDGVEELPMR